MQEPVSPPFAIVANARQWAARSLDSILGSSGYTVLRATDCEEVTALVRRIRPDVLLLDRLLPPDGGVELCRRLRTNGEVDPVTPVLITSEDAPPRAVRLHALRAGAWDCVVLPTDFEELLLKLHCFVQAKSAADRIREASLVDRQTGLYSERGVLRRAAELGAEAARHSRPMACIAVAPEVVDDAAGLLAPHPPVDESTLDALGHLLDSATRESDVVGRMGRAEFVVLAPETDVPGALRLAERLRATADTADAGQGRLSLRAGCYAVENFRSAAIPPVELMVRATLALRQAQSAPDNAPIRLFGVEGEPT